MAELEEPLLRKEPDGTHFILPVYTRRYGYADLYRVWLTDTGWYIRHIAHNGPTDPSGHPVMEWNFRQDYVPRPVPGFDTAMRVLWEDAHAKKLTNDQIQHRLDYAGSLIEDWEKLPKSKQKRRR